MGSRNITHVHLSNVSTNQIKIRKNNKKSMFFECLLSTNDCVGKVVSLIII